MTGDKQGNLVRRLREHDPEAMSELYELYGRLLYVLIVRIVRQPAVAEDLVQECFLRAWNRADQIHEECDAAGPWLTSIARNCALDYLKSSQARFAATVSPENMTVPAAADTGMLARDQKRVIEAGLRNLSEQQKEVIRLSFYEGLSQMAIAERMQQPLGTVKSWSRSALARLRGTVDPGMAQVRAVQ